MNACTAVVRVEVVTLLCASGLLTHPTPSSLGVFSSDGSVVWVSGEPSYGLLRAVGNPRMSPRQKKPKHANPQQKVKNATWSLLRKNVNGAEG